MSKSIESVWSTVKSQIYRVLWKSGVCFIGRFSVSKAEEIREMIWNVAVYGQQQNHQWKSIFWLAQLKSIDIAYRESETIRITITVWIIKRRRREKTTKSKGTFYCEYENVVLFSWNIFLYFGFFWLNFFWFSIYVVWWLKFKYRVYHLDTECVYMPNQATRTIEWMFLLCIAVFFIISLVLFISEMAERKFTRGLNKPGMAAQLRESVSQVVRESAVLVSVMLLAYILNCYLTYKSKIVNSLKKFRCRPIELI